MPKKPNRNQDRHSSGFMVRLPEVYREKIAEVQRKSRRSITVEVQIALDAHLKANGVQPPDSST